MSSTILIVDDEENIRSSLVRIFQFEGYECQTAGSVSEALKALGTFTPDLAMLDVHLPDGNGLELLELIKKKHSQVPVIVMSGQGTIDIALEAIRKGAQDFLEKPLSTDRVLITVANALKFDRTRRELATLREKVAPKTMLLGQSKTMLALQETIQLAAPTNSRVLITGESGTGKELVARSIHDQSKRSEAPFIKLNCAAIPSELIESELFGHEKGAFTGATGVRKGKFELAHKGTLFLDEVGDMRIDVQAKLLRALQEGEIERVGGSQTIQVDVRVLAATNKDLSLAIDEGEFREDLFYRLNVIPVSAPPLRRRKDDLPLLIESFVGQVCKENDLKPKTVSSEGVGEMMKHDWPGNVRELRNACERLVILSPGDVVTDTHVRRLLGNERSVQDGLYKPDVPMREMIADAERCIIQEALDAHDGNVTRTAGSLDLERSHLYKKMRTLGIER
jgi:two-component system, NtrC family, nitrogen regulation response regulator NtrX